MPNIKSSSKRDQLSKLQRARNKTGKTVLKSAIKKFDSAIADGNLDSAVSTYKVTVKAIDRSVSKGLIHKNNAAHKKSKMTQKLNNLSK